jgi:hypothetical protein
MFGITSKNKSRFHDEAFRNHYCGTCKIIAKEYGHLQRLTLNHDIVFLSELYEAVNCNETDYSGISNYHCFELPESELKLPHNLRYAASLNVLLANFKIEDNISDSNYKLKWKIAKKLNETKAQKAKKTLENFGLSVNKLDELINNHFLIENNYIKPTSGLTDWRFISKYISELTGLCFQGILNKENQNLSNVFHEIGSHFGELVYVYDAIKDQKEDLLSKSFNAINFNKHASERELYAAKIYVNKLIDKLKLLIGKIVINEEEKLYLQSKIDVMQFTCSGCPSIKKIKFKTRIKLAFNSAINYGLKNKRFAFRSFLIPGFIMLFIVITILIPSKVFAIGFDPIIYDGSCGSDTCGCCCDCCCCGENKDCYCCQHRHANTDCARSFGDYTFDESCRTNGVGKTCCGTCCIVWICSCFSGCLPDGGGSGGGPIVIIKEIPSPGACCK